MRVLYISPFPPARDGIGEYTSVLANSVRASGSDVDVVVPMAIPDMPTDVVGAIPALRMSLPHLRGVIASWNVDIVHVQFAVAAFGSRIFGLMRLLQVLSRDFNIPVVVTVHELNRELPLLGISGRLLHRWIAARSDHLLVHTNIARDSLITEVGVMASKVTVVPYPCAPRPVDTVTESELRSRFRLGTARVLLAFGFIHVDKGLDDLLKAMQILMTSQNPDLVDVRLVIAGAVRPRRGLFRAFELRDRIYLRHLKMVIRRTGLRPLVTMTDYVPDGEVGPWFDVAAAVVLPYRRIEQSGVAGLAKSLGVPVLASTAGGLSEQCAGSRWTFPPLAPPRMAQTITEFLRSCAPADDESATPACDLKSVTESTMQLYESLIDQSRPGSRCGRA